MENCNSHSNIQNKLQAVRFRFDQRNKLNRQDDDWITINHTHVLVDDDGNLQGDIGKKINSTSQKHNQSANSTSHKKRPTYSEQQTIRHLKKTNPIWKKYYNKLGNSLSGLLPKDSAHSTGTNYKGETVTLALQGKGFQEKYNNAVNDKTHYSVYELTNSPEWQKMDSLCHKCQSMIGGNTANDNSAERQRLRQDVLKAYLHIGSAVKNSDGSYSHTGKTKREFKACIVIGRPGCGKSSTIVDPWSETNGGFILDNDTIKSLLPEFEASNGAAASSLHGECSILNLNALNKILYGKRKGMNICIPTIGDSVGAVNHYLESLEKAGYDVEIKLAEGSAQKSANRVFARAVETGRIIPSSCVKNKGDCKAVLDYFKKLKNAKGNNYVR